MNGSEMRSESPYTMLKRRHHQTRLEGIRWARYLVMGRGSRQEQPRIHCNLIPPRNGETTCVSRWLPSITAENQWDHACNLLPDPQREGNTLWFMINSKLAGGANSFPSNPDFLRSPPPDRTRCMKLVDGSSSLKITLTHLGWMGKVRLHDGYVTFSISGHFWTQVVLLPHSATISSTLLCSNPVLNKRFLRGGKLTASSSKSPSYP